MILTTLLVFENVLHMHHRRWKDGFYLVDIVNGLPARENGKQ